MKILINTASTYKGGGVQVAYSFIKECRKYPNDQFHIVLGKMLDKLIIENDFPDNFAFYRIGYRPATRVYSFNQSGYFKELEQKIKPDVVFTTSGPAYWRPKAPHLVGYNLPHYIYRDSPFFSKLSLHKKIRWYLKGIAIKYFFKRDSDAYVVQTDDINNRLQKLLDTQNVFTVSNTFSNHYKNPQNFANKLSEKQSNEFRFLTLSAWYTHKNLSIIPKVVEALPESLKNRVRFVLTLPEAEFKRYFSSKSRSNIINVGPVKPEEGPSLYNECDAVFLPTLLECFSANYAEAMKMGKPIVTSDLGFAHTVCGNAALYIDPMDPVQIVKKITKLVNCPELREKLIAEGVLQQTKFPTAEERADEYLKICRKLAEAKQIEDKKIVIVNQAVNYLTIGLCNAFAKRYRQVDLITGSIHEQGEALDRSIEISKINKWVERPAWKKLLSYVLGCIQIYWLLMTKYRKHEVFFVSLPPMAYLMSIILPNRCSMLIWDVYPDVFKITGMNESHPIYQMWAKLNRIVFKKAYRLYTIGDKMADLLSNYVDRTKIHITPIWSIFQSDRSIEKEKNPFAIKENLNEKFVVQYSGNIGLTHNVEVMIELAELMKDHEDILFQIIGRGPRVPYLQNLVEEKGLPNCQFLPFQSDEMFPYSLSAADIGVVILDKITSKGSVPSKSYNLMSYGIPSLYIASKDSELHEYAVKYGHAKCVDHNNLYDAVSFILEIKNNKELKERYAQNAIKASKNYRRSNADKIVELYSNVSPNKDSDYKSIVTRNVSENS